MSLLDLLLYLVAFLFPLATYCLALGIVNRKSRPVLVYGTWDALGLLFAMSGFLLVTVPGILRVFYVKTFEALVVRGEAPTGAETPSEHRLQWLIIILLYYLVVVAGSAYAIWTRRSVSIIYNIDPQAFAAVFTRVLARLGLSETHSGGRRFLVEITEEKRSPETAVQPAGPDRRPPALPDTPGTPAAELQVDLFAALHNVTLHWQRVDEQLRQRVETELANDMRQVHTYHNPAGGWLLGIAGFLFGAVGLIVLLLGAALLLPPVR